MSEISGSMTIFWRVIDAALVLLGVVCVWQPLPIQSAEGLLGARQAERLGLSSHAVDALRPIVDAQARVADHEQSALRVIGIVFVLCGGVGATFPVSQPLLFAAASALTSVSLIILLYGEHRRDARRAALLGTPAESDIPWWALILLAALALVDATIGTAPAFAVAAATVICDGCLVAFRLQPEFLVGENPVLEREINRRYRVTFLLTFLIMALLPSAVLAATETDLTPPVAFMKLVVGIVTLAVGILVTGARRRMDRDLQRAVASLAL